MSEPQAQSNPSEHDNSEQLPILQLVQSEVVVFSLEAAKTDETKESAEIIQLFPDEVRLFEDAEKLDEPVIQLLPENATEEELLRLKVKMLEAELARKSAQVNFAERIDVDHLEWRRQQNMIAHLQVGNVLLIILSIVLMISAGCLAVIRY
ncbi:MAG TPA: hypothetical protein V6C97_24590 [Oculatellaceae cyanobacterium]